MLPVILLVVTGIPLEFTSQLKLDSTFVQNEWVLDHYSIGLPSHALMSDNVAQIEQTLYLDHRTLPTDSKLVGAVDIEIGKLIALQNLILIVPFDENIPFEQFPHPSMIEKLGLTRNRTPVLQTASGLIISHDLGASWMPMDKLLDSSTIIWQTANLKTVPVEFQNRFRQNKLSWERLTQDLHSGRFFGPIGEWIMSLAGLALIVLAFTGCIVWWRSRRLGLKI